MNRVARVRGRKTTSRSSNARKNLGLDATFPGMRTPGTASVLHDLVCVAVELSRRTQRASHLLCGALLRVTDSRS